MSVRRVLAPAAAIGLLFAIASALAGQEPSRSPVTGRVVDASTGAGVAGAELLDADAGRVIAHSDSAGRFVLAAGVTRLTVRRLGFAPRQVSVTSARNTPLVVGLDPLPIALEAVVVTAARREQKLKDAVPETQLVSRRDIEQSGSPDLAGALTQTAGIQLEGGVPAGSGVYLQGLGSQRVLVLLDGQPLVGRLNGNLDLSRIPASLIERIEVVRGPQSTLYGSDAMGGVINVITRRPGGEGLELGAAAAAGTQGRMEGSVAALGSAGIAGFALDAGARSQGLAPGLPGDAGTYARSWNAAPRIRLDAAPGFSIEGAALLVGERQRYRAGQLFHFSDNTQSDLRLGAEWRDGERRLAPVVSYSRFDHLSRLGTGAEPASDSGASDVQELVQGEVVYSGPLPAGVVDLGVVLRRAAIRADRVQGRTRSLDAVETYAQATWRFGGLSVAPGLRLTSHEQYGTAWTPRVALLWRPAPAVAVRSSIGAGYRAPDFKELYYSFVNAAAGYAVAGNPDLRPERSTSVSVGVEVVGHGLYGRASAFDNRFRDFIDYTAPDAGGTYTLGNIARGTTRGGELEAGWTVPGARVEVKYAYLQARDDSSGAALLGRAAHSGRVGGDAAILGARLGAQVRFTGRTPVSRDPASGLTTRRAPFTRVDLRLSIPVGSSLGLSVGVDNLFDRRMGDAWPGFTGRQLFAGLSWGGTQGRGA